MKGPGPRLRRLAIALFVAAALVFFALALIDAWNATDGELPSVARLLIAGALASCGLIAGAIAWGLLLGGRRVDHGAALLVSQLGKYIPGGVWQASGQVGLAKSAGVGLHRGTVAFSVLILTQVIAGATYAPVLAVTWSDGAVVVRALLVAAGMCALVLLDRRWMVWLLEKIPRTRGASHDLVPSQRLVLTAYLLGLVNLLAAGSAYVVLLGGLSNIDRPVNVLAAYATAWTIGLLAVPIPSGVGIREAVLVALLHRSFPSSVLVAASVYQRLCSVAVEGLLAALAAHRVRPSRLARGQPSADAESM